MRCVITGHTHGLGKHLAERFASIGWDVIGLSRSNGYDISDTSKVVDVAAGADLFVNCSYGDGHQINLLHALRNKVGKMVVCGSISRMDPFTEYIDSEYVRTKQELAQACELYTIDPETQTDILHLDITFLENPVKFDPRDPNNFSADYQIEFAEVADVIEYWIDHPKIRQVEFCWKLTPFLIGCLKRINKQSVAVDNLVNELRNNAQRVA